MCIRDSDVTVVDVSAERLQALQDRLDLRTVCGHALSLIHI